MLSATEYIVRTKELVKIFKLGDEVLRALNGVSVDIRRGEYISIMGPSGSGKSTLFNAIGGLDRPDSGSVFINDVDMAQLDADELAFLRCHTIGYIFQTFNLITVMTALENVRLPTIFAGMSTDDGIARGARAPRHSWPRPSARSQAVRALRRSATARRYREVARKPPQGIILADEPTGNLDSKTGEDIIALLRRLNKEQGVTIITATHDYKMVDVSDRTIWIRDGKVEKIQDRSEITSTSASSPVKKPSSPTPKTR